MARFSQTAYSLATDPSSRAALIDRLALIAAGGAGELTPANAALLGRLAVFAAGGAGEATPARMAALQRLIDDLTAARAAFLDAAISSRTTGSLANLDAAVSSRAPAGESKVQSRQRGVISVSTGGGSSGSATAAISSVNTAKAHAVHLGHDSVSWGNVGDSASRVELTAATTVTAFLVLANAGGFSARVGYEVVEEK